VGLGGLSEKRVLGEIPHKEKGPACAGPSLFLGRKHPTEDAMNVAQAVCLVVAEMSHRRCKVSARKSPAASEQSRKLEQPIDEDEGYGVKMECCLLASKTNQEAYMGNDDSRWAASRRKLTCLDRAATSARRVYAMAASGLISTA
jgi:hypothetical protein